MLTDYHLHLRPDDADATRRRSSSRRRTSSATATPPRSAGSPSSASPSTSTASRRRSRSGTTRSGRRYAADDLDEYCAFVREQTDLRLGIEADFVPGAEDRIGERCSRRATSTTWSARCTSSATAPSTWTTTASGTERPASRPRRSGARYFETVAESAAQRPVRHPRPPGPGEDLGLRAPRAAPEGDLRRYYELAVEAIAESGVAVEVSTAGLRKPVGEIYPAPPFLEMCLEAGVPIALSSDAHRPAGRRRRLRAGARAARASSACSELSRVRAPRAAPGADRRTRRDAE